MTNEYSLLLITMFHIHNIEKSELHSRLVPWLADGNPTYISSDASWQKPTGEISLDTRSSELMVLQKKVKRSIFLTNLLPIINSRANASKFWNKMLHFEGKDFIPNMWRVILSRSLKNCRIILIITMVTSITCRRLAADYFRSTNIPT